MQHNCVYSTVTFSEYKVYRVKCSTFKVKTLRICQHMSILARVEIIHLSLQYHFCKLFSAASNWQVGKRLPIYYLMVEYSSFLLDDAFINPQLAKIFERVRQSADFMPTKQMMVQYELKHTEHSSSTINLLFIYFTLLHTENCWWWSWTKLEGQAGVLWGEAVCSCVHWSGALREAEGWQGGGHEDSGISTQIKHPTVISFKYTNRINHNVPYSTLELPKVSRVTCGTLWPPWV